MSSKKSKNFIRNNLSIVVGMGEVGTALFDVLSKHYNVVPIDKKWKQKKQQAKGFQGIGYLHICIPWSKEFLKEVKRYQKIYKPKYTIIHSTVPVGTCGKLKAIHSPVRGIHPFLGEGLWTFVKYLSGEKASEVADYFRRAGFRIYLFDKPETTELMKILSTTKYGLDIEFTKEVKRLCQKYKVPFEAWTIWTNDYNQGYRELGYPELARPNLIPIMTPIKGHCVKQNLKLLKSKFTRFLKKL